MKLIYLLAVLVAEAECMVMADTNGFVLGPPRLFKEIALTNSTQFERQPNTIRIFTNEPAWKTPTVKYRVYEDVSNYERVRITQTNESPSVLVLKQESSGTGIPSRPWKITLIDETNTVTISAQAGGPLKVEWNHMTLPLSIWPEGSTNSGRNPKHGIDFSK